MNRLEEIKTTLIKMSSILDECGKPDWSRCLLKMDRYIDDDPEEAIFKLLSLYGGMGSLNDIVLYKEGNILEDENDLFDKLKKRLYELCYSR